MCRLEIQFNLNDYTQNFANSLVSKKLCEFYLDWTELAPKDLFYEQDDINEIKCAFRWDSNT